MEEKIRRERKEERGKKASRKARRRLLAPLRSEERFFKKEIIKADWKREGRL